MSDLYLVHSTKGSEWKDHKYISKSIGKSGKMVYKYTEADARQDAEDIRKGNESERLSNELYKMNEERLNLPNGSKEQKQKETEMETFFEKNKKAIIEGQEATVNYINRHVERFGEATTVDLEGNKRKYTEKIKR